MVQNDADKKSASREETTQSAEPLQCGIAAASRRSSAVWIADWRFRKPQELSVRFYGDDDDDDDIQVLLL